MKKTFLLLLTALFTVSVYAKDIKELIVTTNPPMHCENCEKKIKDNLRFEKGVKKIETNVPDQRVTVTYDADKTNPKTIEKGFKKIGYDVKVVNTDGKTQATPQKSGEVKEGTGCSGSCCGNKK